MCEGNKVCCQTFFSQNTSTCDQIFWPTVLLKSRLSKLVLKPGLGVSQCFWVVDVQRGMRSKQGLETCVCSVSWHVCVCSVSWHGEVCSEVWSTCAGRVPASPVSMMTETTRWPVCVGWPSRGQGEAGLAPPHLVHASRTSAPFLSLSSQLFSASPFLVYLISFFCFSFPAFCCLCLTLFSLLLCPFIFSWCLDDTL